jgi:hypothetical protein
MNRVPEISTTPQDAAKRILDARDWNDRPLAGCDWFPVFALHRRTGADGLAY